MKEKQLDDCRWQMLEVQCKQQQQAVITTAEFYCGKAIKVPCRVVFVQTEFKKHYP